MIQRISSESARELKRLFQTHRTFRMIYRTVRELSGSGELFPEEIWLEATREVADLARSEHKHFMLESLDEELEDKYGTFQNLDGSVASRSRNEAQQTMVLVLLTMLYKLAQAGKDYEDHPNKDICTQIGEMVAKYPVYHHLLNQFRAADDTMDNGGEHFEELDYMSLDFDTVFGRLDSMTGKALLEDMIEDVRHTCNQKNAEALWGIVSRLNKRNGNLYSDEEDILESLIGEFGKAELHAQISGSNVIFGNANSCNFPGKTMMLNDIKAVEYGKR